MRKGRELLSKCSENEKKCYCESAVSHDRKAFRSCFIQEPKVQRKSKTASVVKFEIPGGMKNFVERKKIVSVKVSKDKKPFKPAPAKTTCPIPYTVTIRDPPKDSVLDPSKESIFKIDSVQEEKVERWENPVKPKWSEMLSTPKELSPRRSSTSQTISVTECEERIVKYVSTLHVQDRGTQCTTSASKSSGPMTKCVSTSTHSSEPTKDIADFFEHLLKELEKRFKEPNASGIINELKSAVVKLTPETGKSPRVSSKSPPPSKSPSPCKSVSPPKTPPPSATPSRTSPTVPQRLSFDELGQIAARSVLDNRSRSPLYNELLNSFEPTIAAMKTDVVLRQLRKTEAELKASRAQTEELSRKYQNDMDSLTRELSERNEELMNSLNREKELKLSVDAAQRQLDEMNKSFTKFNDCLKKNSNRVKQLQEENRKLENVQSALDETKSKLKEVTEERDAYKTKLVLSGLERDKIAAYLSIKEHEIERLMGMVKQQSGKATAAVACNTDVPDPPNFDPPKEPNSPLLHLKLPLLALKNDRKKAKADHVSETTTNESTNSTPNSLFTLKQELNSFFVQMKQEAELLAAEAEQTQVAARRLSRTEPLSDLSSELCGFESLSDFSTTTHS